MTASPRQGRQGFSSRSSFNTPSNQVPLRSGSGAHIDSPQLSFCRSRMPLTAIVSGVALVLLVVSNALGPSTFHGLKGATQEQLERELQLQHLRSITEANVNEVAAGGIKELQVSELADASSNEVALEVAREALKNAVLAVQEQSESQELELSDGPETEYGDWTSIEEEYAVTHNISGGHPLACTLNPDGPVPVALVTLGRSGSSSIWQVMGTLTGKDTDSVEYAGSDVSESRAFLDSLQDDDNGNWALDFMCQKQAEIPTAGIVGFKWKPFQETFFEPKSIAALRMMARTHNPQIKVVRSKRNGLDRAISIYKHRQEGGAPAHCSIGNKKCIEAHLKAATGLVVPVDDLVRRLKKEARDELRVDRVLRELGVPHVQVSFDDLFYGQNVAKEWARIFDFLGVGPTHELTVKMVEEAMRHAATSNKFHNQTIANFDEVSSALKGTEFQNWLH